MKEKNIFLSRPTWVSPEFTRGLEGFYRLLESHKLKARTIGTTDYPAKSPLDEVIALMKKCRGAIILGYPQITVEAGKVKDNLITSPFALGTEWNHIEAGLAYASSLPLLIIHHMTVKRGIFDRGASNCFLHAVDFADPAWALDSKIAGALNSWAGRVGELVPKMPGITVQAGITIQNSPDERTKFERQVTKDGAIYLRHKSQVGVYACANCLSTKKYIKYLQPDPQPLSGGRMFTCSECMEPIFIEN
jgi:hypothetical protein